MQKKIPWILGDIQHKVPSIKWIPLDCRCIWTCICLHSVVTRQLHSVNLIKYSKEKYQCILQMWRVGNLVETSREKKEIERWPLMRPVINLSANETCQLYRAENNLWLNCPCSRTMPCKFGHGSRSPAQFRRTNAFHSRIGWPGGQVLTNGKRT